MVQENDQDLLRAYARHRCEASFSELVHRHVDLDPLERLPQRGAEATFHTLNCAAANHETNAFLKATGLEPAARQRAEELFAQMPEAIRQRYGSVDALLVDWAMNGADAAEAYRILSQRQDGPDAASLTVQFQYPNSRVRESEASFYRDQDGNWRRAVPAALMEKLPDVINNLAPATAAK